MAWPTVSLKSGAYETGCAVLIGLVLGGLFTRLFRDQVWAFRLTVIGSWVLFAGWFFVRALFFVKFSPMWHGNPLLFVRGLVSDFAIRETACAGAFWIGTYLGILRRSGTQVVRSQ